MQEEQGQRWNVYFTMNVTQLPPQAFTQTGTPDYSYRFPTGDLNCPHFHDSTKRRVFRRQKSGRKSNGYKFRHSPMKREQNFYQERPKGKENQRANIMAQRSLSPIPCPFYMGPPLYTVLPFPMTYGQYYSGAGPMAGLFAPTLMVSVLPMVLQPAAVPEAVPRTSSYSETMMFSTTQGVNTQSQTFARSWNSP